MEVAKLVKVTCSEMIPSPLIISVLFTEYTPPTVRMGMNINTNIRMPNHLGTQL
jgi:hypothetical protein